MQLAFSDSRDRKHHTDVCVSRATVATFCPWHATGCNHIDLHQEPRLFLHNEKLMNSS